MDSDDVAALAAALRAEAADLEALVGALERTIGDLLGPGVVQVRRRGLGRRRVAELVVVLGSERLSLRPGPPLEAEVQVVSGGVTIAHERIGLDSWIDRLAHALEERLRQTQAGTEALRRLLGLGGDVL
jgi:hypothetical protein